jgi:hypothetical protein
MTFLFKNVLDPQFFIISINISYDDGFLGFFA